MKKCIFNDQETFMKACGQSTTIFNKEQFDMYCKLILEETEELKEAIAQNNQKETLDAIIDIIVVTIGAGHSLGFDLNGAWEEVMKSNLAKIDSSTGKVIKRQDGKILKPKDWKAPELGDFLTKNKL